MNTHDHRSPHPVLLSILVFPTTTQPLHRAVACQTRFEEHHRAGAAGQWRGLNDGAALSKARDVSPVTRFFVMNGKERVDERERMEMHSAEELAGKRGVWVFLVQRVFCTPMCLFMAASVESAESCLYPFVQKA